MILCFFLMIYWKFNLEEIEDKINHSFSMPIFIICYTNSCKQCKDIDRQYSDFISLTGNRTDLYTSKIDCIENEEYCSYLNVHITPTSILILGNNSKYWPTTNSNQAEDWNLLIDKSLGGNLKRIKDSDNRSEKVQEVIRNTLNSGGVTYYLIIQYENDKTLNTFRKLAYRYLIFNVSFLYFIDPTVESYELRRYFTADYYEVSQGDISHSIKEVQFGPLHQYDLQEWNNINSIKIFLFTKNNYLLTTQKDKLISLSNEFGSKIRFGWVYVNNLTEFNQFFHYKGNDLPITIFYNLNLSCYVGTKQRTRDINSSIIEDFLNDRINCNQTIGEIPISKPTIAIQHFHNNAIDGKTFLLWSLLIGLILIGLIRLHPIRESKNE